MKVASNDRPVIGPQYEYDPQTGVWKRPDLGDAEYSDEEESESNLARIIASVNDVSLFSDELRLHCTDRVTNYHLSPQRANLLRPFLKDLSGLDVLEIGAECGAITRAIGEQGARVVALEESINRAKIARSRTRDIPGVSIICDRFAEFEIDRKFDFIILIGGLEYASLHCKGHDPIGSMLDRAKHFLSADGKIIIATENQFGLKYFAGASDGHVGQHMCGIEGRYRGGQPRMVGRREIERQLRALGLSFVEFYLPFPDYKFANSIVSETALNCADFDASAFAWQNVMRDQQQPVEPYFSQEMAWSQVFGNGLGLDLSNSFLILASSRSSRISSSNLAWHFSTSRKPHYCKQTKFERDVDDSIVVKVERLLPGIDSGSEGANLKFNPAARTQYVMGRSMAKFFIEIVASEGWLVGDVVDFFQTYRTVLSSVLKMEPDRSAPAHNCTEFPGFFLDAIPQNLIQTADGSWKYIDQEWASAEAVDFRYLLFRSLLMLSGSISCMGRPANPAIQTWGDLLYAVFNGLGLGLPERDRKLFISKEINLQKHVTGQSLRLKPWFNKPFQVRRARSQDIQLTPSQVMRIEKRLSSPGGLFLDRILYQVIKLILKSAPMLTPRQIAKLTKSMQKRDPKKFKVWLR